MAVMNFQGNNRPGVNSSSTRSFRPPKVGDYKENAGNYLEMATQAINQMGPLLKSMGMDSNDLTVDLTGRLQPFYEAKVKTDTDATARLNQLAYDSAERQNWANLYGKDMSNKRDTYANISNGYMQATGTLGGSFGNVASAYANQLRV